MSKLLLVRHGATEFNQTRRFAGHSDVEMNTVGYSQIERLRDRLANEQIDVIYSSDLRRALVTAETISNQHKVELITYSELREVNYGNLEGLTFQEISQSYPEVAEAVTNFNLRLKFPGGESFTEFIARVCRFLDKLKSHTPSQTILVVTHSGPLRVLACCLLGVDYEHWWQFRFDTASLSVIETYPQGAIINLLNDTSHLRVDI